MSENCYEAKIGKKNTHLWYFYDNSNFWDDNLSFYVKESENGRVQDPQPSSSSNSQLIKVK